MIKESEPKTVLCERCRKNVPVSEIRYVVIAPGQIKLICNSCRGSKKNDSKLKTKSNAQKIINESKSYF